MIPAPVSTVVGDTAFNTLPEIVMVPPEIGAVPKATVFGLFTAKIFPFQITPQ
ncbi:hypothetical protein POBR111598_10060 [Polynucleobacter brandtiae]